METPSRFLRIRGGESRGAGIWAFPQGGAGWFLARRRGARGGQDDPDAGHATPFNVLACPFEVGVRFQGMDPAKSDGERTPAIPNGISGIREIRVAHGR